MFGEWEVGPLYSAESQPASGEAGPAGGGKSSDDLFFSLRPSSGSMWVYRPIIFKKTKTSPLLVINPRVLNPLPTVFVCDWLYRPCFIFRGATVAASGRPVRWPPAADSRAHPILPDAIQSSRLTVLGHSLYDALSSRRFNRRQLNKNSFHPSPLPSPTQAPCLENEPGMIANSLTSHLVATNKCLAH